eukprot:2691406-Rhodomonas_salina.1
MHRFDFELLGHHDPLSPWTSPVGAQSGSTFHTKVRINPFSRARKTALISRRAVSRGRNQMRAAARAVQFARGARANAFDFAVAASQRLRALTSQCVAWAEQHGLKVRVKKRR